MQRYSELGDTQGSVYRGNLGLSAPTGAEDRAGEHMDGLGVELDQRRTALLVRVKGSAGINTAHELDKAARLIRVKRPRRLIVDLTGLTFIASLGLGLLVALAASVRADGGSMTIAGTPPHIERAMRLCRLDRVLTMCATVEEAMGG